jgi:hypothetical protein
VAINPSCPTPKAAMALPPPERFQEQLRTILSQFPPDPDETDEVNAWRTSDYGRDMFSWPDDSVTETMIRSLREA